MEVGDDIPEFTVKDSEGNDFTLSDLKGRWTVLYFYPKDNTPGCTIEANDFTKLLPKFKEIDFDVIGVSADSPEKHCNFMEKYDLKVKLLSDEERKLLEPLGVWRLKKFMGKEFMGIARTTFIVDPNGRIAHVWDKVKASGHADEVLAKARELSK